MNSLVLDTNAYVAYLNGDNKIVAYVQAAEEIILPFIVIGELHYGFFKGSKAPENIKVLQEFQESPRVRIIQSDDDVNLVFGEIATELASIGKPMQQNDIWIAAICKRHNYSLLTYDKGFKNIIGLKLLPL